MCRARRQREKVLKAKAWLQLQSLGLLPLPPERLKAKISLLDALAFDDNFTNANSDINSAETRAQRLKCIDDSGASLTSENDYVNSGVQVDEELCCSDKGVPAKLISESGAKSQVFRQLLREDGLRTRWKQPWRSLECRACCPL